MNIFFRHTNILVSDILIGSCKIKAFCSYPWTRVKFTPEGDVTMCCFHARKCLGNIFQNSFEEIWFSPLAEQIRKDTSNQILHRTCSGNSCPFSKLKNLPLIDFDHGKFPHELEIDLPNQHCNIGGERPNAKNLACLMCERNRRDPDEFYQEDRLQEICFKIKPIMSHIKWVHIQGVAEPFWKNKIFEILKWLDVNGNKVWISTTTNGTLMNENHRKMFLEYPSSTITWSLDAGTAETFKIIRRVDMFDQIIENLMNYSRERKQGQFIHIHNNINTININDVEEMVKIAAKVGVDRLDFNATYDVPAICVNKENVHIFKEAQDKIVYLSQELGVNTTFMRNLTLDIL